MEKKLSKRIPLTVAGIILALAALTMFYALFITEKYL
ncbi:Uncharacterised protein [Legionella steigerwaltii]|uniref:Uncharacterized protein n=1 Tax=Legionella steigerwaltii TaxID=460 RepID=A0A378L8X9_9GAMM|nr:Uncharacterised protein [Legionella steigerwaltii]